MIAFAESWTQRRAVFVVSSGSCDHIPKTRSDLVGFTVKEGLLTCRKKGGDRSERDGEHGYPFLLKE